jgi:hypothetical protein
VLAWCFLHACPVHAVIKHCAALSVQLINWLLALADGNAAGAPGQGFKQAGFESFERIWTGQQVCGLCEGLRTHVPLSH